MAEHILEKQLEQQSEQQSEQLPPSLLSLLSQLDREGVTGVDRYRKVRRYIQFKAREEHIPVCGTFELTPLCNLACKMCYVHLDKEQMDGQELLPVETWISIIDQAVDAGMLYATVTGGECLTYGGFKEAYLHLRKRGIEISLLTNGVLLTEEMVCFLDEHPPASIQITLYGPDEDEYERITGHRAFQKVMDSLARLKAHNLPFIISVTPNFYMTKGKELIRLLYELDMPFRINSGLMVPRKETGRKLWDAPLDIYMDLYKEELRLREGKKQIMVPISDEDLPDPGSSENGKGTKSRKGVLCAAGRSSFCVTWNGKMKPCNTFPGIEEDVLCTGFQSAWERISGKVQEILLPVECTNCPYESVCNQCIVEHLDHGAPGHANPNVCEHIRRRVKEGLVQL